MNTLARMKHMAKFYDTHNIGYNDETKHTELLYGKFKTTKRVIETFSNPLHLILLRLKYELENPFERGEKDYMLFVHAHRTVRDIHYDYIHNHRSDIDIKGIGKYRSKVNKNSLIITHDVRDLRGRPHADVIIMYDVDAVVSEEIESLYHRGNIDGVLINYCFNRKHVMYTYTKQVIPYVV